MKAKRKAFFWTIATSLGTAGPFAAAAEVAQGWHCELKEGKTEADEKAGNDRWVEFVSEHVEGGGIRTFAGHPMVGDLSKFIYVDTFPSLEAWAAMEAAMQTAEGQAVEQALEETSTCESSSLYRIVRSD